MITTLEQVAVRVHRNVYKGCQRCGGDLVFDREAEADLRGVIDYICVQYGRHQPIRSILQQFQAHRPAA